MKLAAVFSEKALHYLPNIKWHNRQSLELASEQLFSNKEPDIFLQRWWRLKSELNGELILHLLDIPQVARNATKTAKITTIC